MPAWIHDRAMSMKKDMEKTYGPEKAKQVAFAVATQQAHRLGKSPKTFKSKVTGKKESFGTPEARSEAKAKFDKPRKEYKKTASEETMTTDLETNEPSTAGEMPHHGANHTDHTVNDMGSPALTNVGTELGGLFDNKTETHQGRETTLKSMSSTPPTIKTAMYGSFLDEFTKIAAKKSFLGRLLGKGRRAASEVAEEVVEAAPKKTTSKMDPRVAKWTKGTPEHAARQAKGAKRHEEMLKRIEREGKQSRARSAARKSDELAKTYRRRSSGPKTGVGSSTSHGGQLVRMD